MIRQRTGLLVIAALTLAACGGGDGGSSGEPFGDETSEEQDDGGPGASSDSSDGSDDPAEFGGAASIAPIDGAVVSVLDLGLGLYGIDPTDGSSGEFSYAEDWYSDRQQPPVIVDSEALTLVYRQIEGEGFSNDIALAAFDLTTGAGREIVALGNDRSSDASADTNQFTLVGAGGDVVWILTATTTAGGDFTRRLTAHSITDGEEIATYSPESVDITTDNGSSCTFTPEAVAVDTDGALILDYGGLPALVAPGATDIEVLLDSCFDPSVTPLALLGDDYADFVVTDDGSELPRAAANRLLDFAPEISGKSIVASDAAIWWLFSRTSSFSDGDIDVSAIIGGFARYDRATGEFTLFDLGPATGTFLDPDTNDGFTQTALTDADLQELDGDLWFMDVREEQPLRRLDAGTGDVDEFVIPLTPVDVEGDAVEVASVDEPVDFVSATLLATDPDGVWIAVSRRTIESDDDNGRTTLGASFIDQVDPATGTVIRSIPEGQLTGFEI